MEPVHNRHSVNGGFLLLFRSREQGLSVITSIQSCTLISSLSLFHPHTPFRILTVPICLVEPPTYNWMKKSAHRLQSSVRSCQDCQERGAQIKKTNKPQQKKLQRMSNHISETDKQVLLASGSLMCLWHLQRPARIWLNGREPRRSRGQRSSPERSLGLI